MQVILQGPPSSTLLFLKLYYLEGNFIYKISFMAVQNFEVEYAYDHNRSGHPKQHRGHLQWRILHRDTRGTCSPPPPDKVDNKKRLTVRNDRSSNLPHKTSFNFGKRRVMGVVKNFARARGVVPLTNSGSASDLQLLSQIS